MIWYRYDGNVGASALLLIFRSRVYILHPYWVFNAPLTILGRLFSKGHGHAHIFTRSMKLPSQIISIFSLFSPTNSVL